MTEWRGAYLEECRRIIRKHGHMIQAVGAAPGSGTELSYTVGLARRRECEFAISGLPPAVAQNILNAAADKVDATGHGLYVDGLIAGWPMLMRETVDRSRFGTIRALYPGRRFTVYQLLFPDAQGIYPGREGYSLGPRDQELL